MFFSKFELRNQNQFSEKQNVFSSHIPAYTTRAPAITSKELFQSICFKCSILTFAKTLTSCSVQLCFVLITQTKTSAYICMGCCFLRTGECPENHLKVIIFMNQNFCNFFFRIFTICTWGYIFHALHYTFYFRLTYYNLIWKPC
jgi:hypothetical protein